MIKHNTTNQKHMIKLHGKYNALPEIHYGYNKPGTRLSTVYIASASLHVEKAGLSLQSSTITRNGNLSEINLSTSLTP